MDPSGIIGIIGVAGQILATCTKLGLNWRDAPDDAKKFKSEVDALHKTLWEIYNHLIQNPDFITAFEGKHSAVLSNLAAPPNSDDSALLFTCKEELEDVLKALQKRLGGSRFGVYILVDALDEFGEDRGILLKSILSVQETENVNIFTTSRHIPEIEIYFNEATSIEIRATDEDVMRFLDGRMSRLPSAARKSRELQGEIKHSIVEAVQGMFLLAQLYFDSLQGKRSAKAIRDALSKFASGSSAYDNAYDEAMERIEGQFEDQEMLAKEALSWIVCARRPLKTLELQHALAVERGTTELDEDNITELEDIVSVCAGLITIDEESDIIRLVHYTTQEYFQRTTERWLPSAQHLIVESFMTYFSFNAFSVGSCHDDSYLESRLEEYPLYEYATLEWGHHAQSILPPSESVISFLMDGQSNLEAAFEVIWYRGRIPDFRTKRPPMELSGLHLAAYFGLKEAFTMIIDRFGPEVSDIYLESEPAVG
ncbi:hypothetical protein Brms1b_009773 [Colletotrichum noveboracense]|nr:hypothetical protein Brms1b_009773 [Colletotrichum noveboracense]